MNNEITPFENKDIRREWHDGQWYFSIVDIIEVLTDSPKPTAYWNKVQKAISKEGQFYPFWIKLKLRGIDGKNYKTDCANTEGILRIVMSIPSPKAEPFKQWLAMTGKERLEEIQDPEIGFERIKELYKAKGYPDEWIERRMQTIEIRKELTEEWKKRGVQQGQEYSILTAEIAKGTFGLTPSEHSQMKGLEKENLRDHMTAFELIFTALGEEAARQFAVNDDAQGFKDNHDAAVKGGIGAGTARKNFEEVTGLKVVSDANFKHLKSGETDKQLETDTPQ